MKGLILAGISMTFLVLLCAVGLRAYRGDKEYKVFLGSLASALILYSLLFAILPLTLGFLPQRMVEPAGAIDFGNGLLVLVLLFHGFWTCAYIMCLGPTMNILLEMSTRPQQGMTMEEILSVFGSDDSLNAILGRRLPKLIKGGYLTEEHGLYKLLPRGRAAGRICIQVRGVLGGT